MGGLSVMHLIIVLVIVLVIFGPNRLPTLGKSLGEAIRGFKKGMETDEIDVTQRRDNLPPGQHQGQQNLGQGQQNYNQQYNQHQGYNGQPQQPYNNQQQGYQPQQQGYNNPNQSYNQQPQQSHEMPHPAQTQEDKDKNKA